MQLKYDLKVRLVDASVKPLVRSGKRHEMGQLQKCKMPSFRNVNLRTRQYCCCPALAYQGIRTEMCGKNATVKVGR